MTRLEWGIDRTYHEGIERGAVYFADETIAWSGLIQVDEKPGNTATKEVYIDGIQVLKTSRQEDFYASIAAYAYPPRIEEEMFGLVYVTGDELHIVYNVTAIPSDKAIQTVNSRVDPVIFGFDLSAVPVPSAGISPTAHLIVDLTQAWPEVMVELTDLLYGTDVSDPSLPSIEELKTLFEEFARYRVIDHGDGTWTAIGPDEAITMVSPTEFVMDWPTAVYLDPETYTISTL